MALSPAARLDDLLVGSGGNQFPDNVDVVGVLEVGVVDDDGLRQADVLRLLHLLLDGVVARLPVVRVRVHHRHIVPVESRQQLDNGVGLLSIGRR